MAYEPYAIAATQKIASRRLHGPKRPRNQPASAGDEGAAGRRIHTVIVFALWRIFLGFSSGGLSMWRFE